MRRPSKSARRQNSRTGLLLCVYTAIGYNLIINGMSFLFHHRTQKIAKMVWGVIAVLIILGMVVFFAPGLTNILTR